MKVNLMLCWFDLWVGFYWSARSKTLYFCPLPMVVFVFRFLKKGVNS